MRKTNLFLLSAILLGVLVFPGCEENPIDKLINPNDHNAVSDTSGIFQVYTDELRTSGGVGLIPSGENQFIDLVDLSEPKHGNAQIAYSWNGQQVFNHETGAYQHLFAGFSLPITVDLTDIDSVPAKNFSLGSYTKMVFWARAALSENTSVRFEGPSDGSSGATPAQLNLSSTEITTAWQEYTLTVPTADFSAVKIFLTVSFQYAQPPRTTNPGNGGIVYVSGVRYEQ